MPCPRATPEPLTRRQAEWLAVIRAHYERTGTAATRHELATAVGCISGAAAAYGCEVLAKKGYIEPDRPLTAAGAVDRISTYYGCEPLERLARHHS
jgi:SOS-response transcriptional repressor LexA